MRTAWLAGMLWVLGCLAASPATPATPPPSPSSAAPTHGPRKAYLLQSRPAVGQRIGYEQSTDRTLHIRADAGGNRREHHLERFHEQTVVTSEEILEIGKPPEIAKKVTFGPQCWSASKINDKPTRKVSSVYADKTVVFRIFEDGALEQDFGVRPTKAQMKRMKNMFIAAADLYPEHPVSVGERWRADRAMAALLDLSHDDTSSTIFTLKEVRERGGREVAVIAVTAGVIKAHERGFNLELSLEGTWEIDVATGVELKIDLIGKSTIAAAAASRSKHGAPLAGVQVAGDGTFEMHRAARLLPPVSEVAGN